MAHTILEAFVDILIFGRKGEFITRAFHRIFDMQHTIRKISALILIGGRSTRMGSPKFLLSFPDGQPAYRKCIALLAEALPEADNICLCLHDPSQQDLACQDFGHARVKLLLSDTPPNVTADQGSPAHCILAAHANDPSSHWLVMPCDFPLLTVEEVEHLRAHYIEPLSCLQNSRGVSEPLLAIWSPESLVRLSMKIAEEGVSVAAAFHEIGGRKIKSLYDHSLFNTNTRDEWDHAMRLLEKQKPSSTENGYVFANGHEN